MRYKWKVAARERFCCRVICSAVVSISLFVCLTQCNASVLLILPQTYLIPRLFPGSRGSSEPRSVLVLLDLTTQTRAHKGFFSHFPFIFLFAHCLQPSDVVGFCVGFFFFVYCCDLLSVGIWWVPSRLVLMFYVKRRNITGDDLSDLEHTRHLSVCWVTPGSSFSCVSSVNVWGRSG